MSRTPAGRCPPETLRYSSSTMKPLSQACLYLMPGLGLAPQNTKHPPPVQPPNTIPFLVLEFLFSFYYIVKNLQSVFGRGPFFQKMENTQNICPPLLLAVINLLLLVGRPAVVKFFRQLPRSLPHLVFFSPYSLAFFLPRSNGGGADSLILSIFSNS